VVATLALSEGRTHRIALGLAAGCGSESSAAKAAMPAAARTRMSSSTLAGGVPAKSSSSSSSTASLSSSGGSSVVSPGLAAAIAVQQQRHGAVDGLAAGHQQQQQSHRPLWPVQGGSLHDTLAGAPAATQMSTTPLQGTFADIGDSGGTEVHVGHRGGVPIVRAEAQSFEPSLASTSSLPLSTEECFPDAPRETIGTCADGGSNSGSGGGGSRSGRSAGGFGDGQRIVVRLAALAAMEAMFSDAEHLMLDLQREQREQREQRGHGVPDHKDAGRGHVGHVSEHGRHAGEQPRQPQGEDGAGMMRDDGPDLCHQPHHPIHHHHQDRAGIEVDPSVWCLAAAQLAPHVAAAIAHPGFRLRTAGCRTLAAMLPFLDAPMADPVCAADLTAAVIDALDRGLYRDALRCAADACTAAAGIAPHLPCAAAAARCLARLASLFPWCLSPALDGVVAALGRLASETAAATVVTGAAQIAAGVVCGDISGDPDGADNGRGVAGASFPTQQQQHQQQSPQAQAQAQAQQAQQAQQASHERPPPQQRPPSPRQSSFPLPGPRSLCGLPVPCAACDAVRAETMSSLLKTLGTVARCVPYTTSDDRDVDWTRGIVWGRFTRPAGGKPAERVVHAATASVRVPRSRIVRFGGSSAATGSARGSGGSSISGSSEGGGGGGSSSVYSARGSLRGSADGRSQGSGGGLSGQSRGVKSGHSGSGGARSVRSGRGGTEAGAGSDSINLGSSEGSGSTGADRAVFCTAADADRDVAAEPRCVASARPHLFAAVELIPGVAGALASWLATATDADGTASLRCTAGQQQRRREPCDRRDGESSDAGSGGGGSDGSGDASSGGEGGDDDGHRDGHDFVGRRLSSRRSSATSATGPGALPRLPLLAPPLAAIVDCLESLIVAIGAEHLATILGPHLTCLDLLRDCGGDGHAPPPPQGTAGPWANHWTRRLTFYLVLGCLAPCTPRPDDAWFELAARVACGRAVAAGWSAGGKCGGDGDGTDSDLAWRGDPDPDRSVRAAALWALCRFATAVPDRGAALLVVSLTPALALCMPSSSDVAGCSGDSAGGGSGDSAGVGRGDSVGIEEAKVGSGDAAAVAERCASMVLAATAGSISAAPRTTLTTGARAAACAALARVASASTRAAPRFAATIS
jgi:hypothetical protein